MAPGAIGLMFFFQVIYGRRFLRSLRAYRAVEPRNGLRESIQRRYPDVAIFDTVWAMTKAFQPDPGPNP